MIIIIIILITILIFKKKSYYYMIYLSEIPKRAPSSGSSAGLLFFLNHVFRHFRDCIHRFHHGWLWKNAQTEKSIKKIKI